jgi:hypothetical protein
MSAVKLAMYLPAVAAGQSLIVLQTPHGPHNQLTAGVSSFTLSRVKAFFLFHSSKTQNIDYYYDAKILRVEFFHRKLPRT